MRSLEFLLGLFGSVVMAFIQFVTASMVPAAFTLEREKERLFHAAGVLAGAKADTSQCIVVVELPDTFTAWAYVRAYRLAAQERDDLVVPMISSREQWDHRGDDLTRVVWCLQQGLPPAVVFCAIVPDKK